MVNFIEFVFFTYIFLGIYTLSLFLFIYFPNRKRLFEYPKARPEPVSIIVPCYNASKTIGKAIDSLLQLDYPKEMIEIIVVDDKSKDDSVSVVRQYVKKYSNVRLIVNKRNSGGAAEPTNIGIRNAKYDYIAVTDDDSMPQPDALIKMLGFLQKEKNVAAVTCGVLAKENGTFFQKLQAIEYTAIAWTRKLLDFVDSVYVTPGPFAVYRKKAVLDVGMFDTKNMTQDIEIVWRLLSRGYMARMCLAARVYTDTPKSFKAWFKQRVRWNIGGTQTLLKYKGLVFKRGMLGVFIIPLFSVSLFLGLFGLGLFAYLFTRRTLIAYLSTKYSLAANTGILYLQDLTFAPSILNFLGASLLLAGLMFTFLALGVMGARKQHNLFNVLFYLLVYLTVLPLVIIVGMTKLITGKYSW